MPNKDAFAATFAELRAVLEPYSKDLLVQADEPNLYSLAMREARDPAGRPLFFGAVRVGKAYVSYHLMPLYMCRELQDAVSPSLRKRMQGKTCFNFNAIAPSHLKELSSLTKKGLARFRKLDKAPAGGPART